MTITEFIEAVKMLNEDKEKAISTYGDPETWSVPGISQIKITEDDDYEIIPNEFDRRIKRFKVFETYKKISDLIKSGEIKNETRHISFGKIEPIDDDEIVPYKKECEFQNDTLLDFEKDELYKNIFKTSPR